MENKKNWLGILTIILVLGIMITGCRSAPPAAPSSFQSGSKGDTSILLRQGLNFDSAFREIIYILNRNGFEPELMQPDVGYIRTRWTTSWNDSGTSVDYYRVQIILNFNPNRTQLLVSAPAQYYRNGNWIAGYDTRAVETLRTDLTLIIGN
jgi:hypothetical protein